MNTVFSLYSGKNHYGTITRLSDKYFIRVFFNKTANKHTAEVAWFRSYSKP